MFKYGIYAAAFFWFSILTFGWALPWLISAQDTIMVMLGFGFITAYIFFIAFIGKSLYKIVKDKINER